ncbi:MAG: MFS transporter [Clostridia bacterium]|nr:MFS transporter [Clostridia bacterium]
MKLNTKRVVFVGFAFFLICTFWQAYDTLVPKILTDKFGMSQSASGIVMALDNLFALFLLPLFGALSDKTKTRLGRRTPYILVGTLLAAAAVIALTFADVVQIKNLGDVALVDSEKSLVALYEHEYDETLKTPLGEEFVLTERFTREEFVAIRTQKNGESNPDYTNYVVPARQAYAADVTDEHPETLVLFIGLLLLVLIAMATFRTPAVALMPDVTIKPLRSKANAIINLLGTAGGILVLVLGIVFATGNAQNALMSYQGFFGVVVLVMLAALGIFLWKVREPLFVREMEEESRRFGIDDETEEDLSKGGKRRLSKAEFRSLVFILASVVFWFMGYNAVTSKYSVYAGEVLNLDYNMTLMLANVAAIISYIPVGILASKIGRKKSIIIGVALLGASFLVAAFLREGSPAMVMNLVFITAGIGWATINVNSFPMVVELAGDSDVGKYTGIYYTASMAAQTLTPYLSGLLMDHVGMVSLFPYATVFVALALGTMFMVRHGDSKPVAKKDKLEMLDQD